MQGIDFSVWAGEWLLPGNIDLLSVKEFARHVKHTFFVCAIVLLYFNNQQYEWKGKDKMMFLTVLDHSCLDRSFLGPF